MQTQPISFWNLRLVAANWMSINILQYALVMLACCTASWAPRHYLLLNRLGRHLTVVSALGAESCPGSSPHSLVMRSMASFPTLSGPAAATITGTITPADWEAYRSRFVEDSGRVVDNANGNISHSEGQG